MKGWKRILAASLCLLMVTGILPAMNLLDEPIRSARAAAPPAAFEAEDFSQCFTKVLLEQVGKGYASGNGLSGYVLDMNYNTKDSRVTSGTPYNPLPVNSTSMDCYGLVITCLMAMGYDSFVDANGKEYPFNAYYGGTIFDDNPDHDNGWFHSIFYDHGTGDILTLHHSNNSLYDIPFKIGEIVDKSKAEKVEPGTLLLSIDSKGNTKSTAGAFSAGQISRVNHAAVALFTMTREDSLPADQSKVKDMVAAADAALTATYDGAIAELARLYPGKNFTGGSYRNTSGNDPYGKHWEPYVWDARGRGRHEASAGNYKTGFIDGHANPVFNTPYNETWQIESLNPNLGVTVNNNPNGKELFRMAVDLIPVHESGTVEITKKDDKTGAVLTGAKFDLYEWSTSQRKFVKSTEYHINEVGKSGKYQVFNSLNEPAAIEFTAENAKTIKVVETQAPPGYQATFSEEHTFTGDGETQTWTVDALNSKLGSLTIRKTTDIPTEQEETYYFYVTKVGDASVQYWKQITIPKGKTSGTVTISDLSAGDYTVLEVAKNEDTVSINQSLAAPYTAKGEGTVTVSTGTPTNIDITNQATKVLIKKRAK